MIAPRPVVAAALVGAVALTLCSSAVGQGEEEAGYEALVRAVDPPLEDVVVTVVRDVYLRLESKRGGAVMILGASGEPYLLFEPDGVRRNENSPSTYLDAVPALPPPPYARPAADPAWSVVNDEPSWEWRDHRLAPAPTGARVAEGASTSWRVPGRAGTAGFAIEGETRIVPPSEQGRTRTVVVVFLVLTALLVVAVTIAIRSLGKPE